MVLPALSTLGYKPRPELGRTIMAQVGRCGGFGGGGGGGREVRKSVKEGSGWRG
jgi:hypothetical protein